MNRDALMKVEAMDNSDRIAQAALVLVEEALFSNGSQTPPANAKIMKPDANNAVRIESSSPQYVGSARESYQEYSMLNGSYLDDRHAGSRIMDGFGRPLQTIEERYFAESLGPGKVPYRASMVVRGANGDLQYELRGTNASCPSSNGTMKPCRGENLSQDFEVFDNVGRKLPVLVHFGGGRENDRLRLSATILKQVRNGDPVLVKTVGQVVATVGVDPTQSKPDYAELRLEKEGDMLGQIHERVGDSSSAPGIWQGEKGNNPVADKSPEALNGWQPAAEKLADQLREEQERVRQEQEKFRQEQEKRRLAEELLRAEERARNQRCVEQGRGPFHGCPIY